MAPLYKIYVIGQIWLTAAMTLVAGMPHFSCACPDGTVKQLCVSGAANSSSCCCGTGKCCSLSDSACCKATNEIDTAGASEKSCYGENRGQIPDQQEGIRLTVTQKCCTRTLTQIEPTAVCYHKTIVASDSSFGTLFSQSFAPMSSHPAAARALCHWQINLAAPPTDLVNLLQHYLI